MIFAPLGIIYIIFVPILAWLSFAYLLYFCIRLIVDKHFIKKVKKN
ncbi:hypothetical protein SAMN05444853_11652 [Pasteurella skyensis]|uniref:Uncharacterized protein n=1 Tax=Phocoenobacter skyensis TaxID=97481 RepID=A0A1H7Y5I0_9PAST|nr:hypothetical protein SAMN05444853_11652 [Pasteurella skyensis]